MRPLGFRKPVLILAWLLPFLLALPLAAQTQHFEWKFPTNAIVAEPHFETNPSFYREPIPQAENGAQTVQKTHCAAVSSCSLANPVAAGDSILAVAYNAIKATDAQGDTFTPISVVGWYGGHAPLFYALNAAGGNVTVTFDVAPSNVYLAEYPPMTLDQSTAQATLCCSASLPVGPLVTAQPNELLLYWQLALPVTTGVFAAGTGFTMEDTGTSITVEDAAVSPGSWTATMYQKPLSGSSSALGGRMVSFVLTKPPPQLTTLQFLVQFVNCTKCDGTDNVPLASASAFQGSQLTLSQDAEQICTATLNASAQASCSAGVNLAPAVIDLTAKAYPPGGGDPAFISQGVAEILLAGESSVTLVIGLNSATMKPQSFFVHTQ